MPAGTLEVFIVEGRNLKDRDLIGQNDAYVEIYLDKKYKQRTTTISNTNDPTWNQRFTFNIQKGDDTIHFDVYDADIIGRDSIGNGKTKLKYVFDDGRFDEWVKLPAKFGLTSHGEIHVIMNFTVSRHRSIVDLSSKQMFDSLLAIVIS
jgi:Ca2+-dependent lipid-binding protein